MSADLLTLGYSQLISALALLGGFIGGAVFYFANQAAKPSIPRFFQIIYFIAFCALISSFVLILSFLILNGSMLIEASKYQPDDQILINLSCENKLNCSANVSSQLRISCKKQTCPEQKICLNITPETIEKQYTNYVKCPPMLSLPKI
jgi:hypothetical protein